MKKKRFTEGQVVCILRKADRGSKPIPDIRRSHGISVAALYAWRQQVFPDRAAAEQRSRDDKGERR
jgi:transposase-like protein